MAVLPTTQLTFCCTKFLKTTDDPTWCVLKPSGPVHWSSYRALNSDLPRPWSSSTNG